MQMLLQIAPAGIAAGVGRAFRRVYLCICLSAL